MGTKPKEEPGGLARAANRKVVELMASSAYTSNRALARAAGWSGDYVNRRISGRVSWDLKDLEVLGALLDIDPVELLVQARRT